MTSLGDLPGFDNNRRTVDNDYDFGGFDDFDDNQSNENKNEQSKYSNAERYLDDFDNEQKEGFKVEVKRPGKGKALPTSSGKKKGVGKFNKNIQNFDQVEENDELIEEEIATDREKEMRDGYTDNI